MENGNDIRSASGPKIPPVQKWRVRIDGTVYGPYSRPEIETYLAEGRLDPSTEIYDASTGTWQPISAFGPLKDLITGTRGADGFGGPNAEVSRDFSEEGHWVFAGFWIRAAALLIDSVIMAIGGGVLGAFVGYGLAAAGSPDSIEPIANLVGFAIGLLYTALMHSGPWQATLGKRAVGIRVIRRDGYPVGFGLAVGRYFATILSAFIFCIGYAMAGWTREKRALHDMICSTRVIYGRP
ncbi:MAG: RDD family protein [Fulvimarina manganoxydans]|uniref:RDD family protein n=1 Tax=Fulvimarina manganoxydans TaxID=937218 RepID=UPI00235322E0|nr:RDD family protein [Fulvimarina manganoxydans]MCK5931848.1 RDD family protein [Fulvimarina manganoxydans]